MAPVQSDRKIRRKTGYTTHGSRSTKNKKTLGTASHGRLGFLNDTFTPLMQLEKPKCSWQQMEKDFFLSLDHFCQLYHPEVPDTTQQSFPFNIAAIYQHLHAWMQKHYPDTNLLLLQKDSGHTFLATAQNVNTGMTLFYIPIFPVVCLLAERKKKQQSDLLLSIFAYLYQIVGIPFYTQEVFVKSMYQRTMEWILDSSEEWDSDTLTHLRKDFQELFREGKRMVKRLKATLHLRTFGKRCKQFQAKNKDDKRLAEIAVKFHQLYQTYPDKSIHQNMMGGFSEDYEDERVYPEQYISFVYRVTGILYDNFSELVNMELQEKTYIHEPTMLQTFDHSQTSIEHDLQFEIQLLDLLHELSYLLNYEL